MEKKEDEEDTKVEDAVEKTEAKATAPAPATAAPTAPTETTKDEEGGPCGLPKKCVIL